MVPHTGLSFNPLHTDWEYLIPSQKEDEEISAQDMFEIDEVGADIETDYDHRPLPVISGFVALVKVFLCVVDFLSDGFPGAPPQAFAMTSGPLQTLVYPESQPEGSRFSASRSTGDLNSLVRILHRLQNVLTELPTELKIPSHDQMPHSRYGNIDSSLIRSNQFDSMRANIHVTSLYIQSKILEACLATFSSSCPGDDNSTPKDILRSSPEGGSRNQLWSFRVSIAHELLQVLHFCSSRTLEANGASMVQCFMSVSLSLLTDLSRL